MDMLVPDMIHNILEGMLQFQDKLVLQHVVRERYVSYCMFAGALVGLELGYMEVNNKTNLRSLQLVSHPRTRLWDKKVGNSLHCTCACLTIHAPLSLL